MIRFPPSAPDWLRETLITLTQHHAERHGLEAVYFKHPAGNGTTVDLRFIATRPTRYVRVHVQSDKDASTGGDGYDPDNSVSSTRVDCREDRQQDVTISRDASSHYYVWLIPVQEEPDGTFTKYDGEGGRDDYMAFADLGK